VFVAPSPLAPVPAIAAASSVFPASAAAQLPPQSRPLPVLPDNPTIADNQLLLACEAMQASNYLHALSLINEALSEPLEPGQGLSTGVLKAEALTMRGSFKYLMNDTNGAKEDFTNALEANPTSIHTWLKMANIHLDHGSIEESLSCL